MLDTIFVLGFVVITARFSKFRPAEDAVMFFQIGDYPKCMIKGLELLIITFLQTIVAHLLLDIFKELAV